jgi:H+-translocating NAD(P) transhydrogenase subunit alpha
MKRKLILLALLSVALSAVVLAQPTPGTPEPATAATPDYWSLFFVLILATFIGVGVIARVSRLLHTPLMSITNAISAIAVVGSIIVTGSDYPTDIRILGAVALFASMTNIVSGFLITDRMLKMFKQDRKEVKP